MCLTPIQAIHDANVVIIGVGSEFGINIEAAVSQNSVYKTYIRWRKDKGFNHKEINEYIINSIYSHELSSGTNELILKHTDTYNKLFRGIKDKEYFVVTTCTDHIIYYSQFDKERITAPCGSVLRLQLSCVCDNGGNGISEGEEVLKNIYEKLESMGENIDPDVLSEMIPKCSECKAPLIFNIHGKNHYNERGYAEEWKRYTDWLQKTLNKNLVLLELGVDFNVPTVIRWPFEKIALINYKAALYRINAKLPQLPEKIGSKGFSINENSFEYINNNF